MINHSDVMIRQREAKVFFLVVNPQLLHLVHKYSLYTCREQTE